MSQYTLPEPILEYAGDEWYLGHQVQAAYRWLRKQPALELRSDGSQWMKDGKPFVASHRLCSGYMAHGHYPTLDETIDAAVAAQKGTP